MSEHLLKAIEELDGRIRQHEQQALEMKRAVNQLCDLSGVEPVFSREDFHRRPAATGDGGATPGPTAEKKTKPRQSKPGAAAPRAKTGRAPSPERAQVEEVMARLGVFSAAELAAAWPGKVSPKQALNWITQARLRGVIARERHGVSRWTGGKEKKGARRGRPGQTARAGEPTLPPAAEQAKGGRIEAPAGTPVREVLRTIMAGLPEPFTREQVAALWPARWPLSDEASRVRFGEGITLMRADGEIVYADGQRGAGPLHYKRGPLWKGAA